MTEIKDPNIIANNEPTPPLYPYGVKDGKPSFYIGFYLWHKSDAETGEPLKEYNMDGRRVVFGETIDTKTNQPYKNEFLYIYKMPEGDKHTICRKLAGVQRVYDNRGNNKDVPEVELYKEAYQLYLSNKDRINNDVSKDEEIEKLKKELEELQNKNKNKGKFFGAKEE